MCYKCLHVFYSGSKMAVNKGNERLKEIDMTMA